MAEGSELLRWAVAKGDASLVKTLFSQGLTADLDKDGRNLLHIAAQNGHLEIVQTLVNRGFNTGSQDLCGYTPLHRASAQGRLEVIEFLLDSGCPIDQQDEYGNTALHAASWNGFSQTVALLLRKKANSNASNKTGFTALHSAGQKGHNETARVLLYAACRMNAKNKYGDTPLHTSTQYGHAGVVRILLSAKCKVNVQNKNGETALHKAVLNKRYKIAKLLIEAGIKKKLKNNLSEMALDISRKLNDNEMILIITSEEKLTKLRHRGENNRRSFRAEDDASSASDLGRRKRSTNRSQQELNTTNLGPAPSRVASHANVAFIRSQSSTAVELNRQSHVISGPIIDVFKQRRMPKPEAKAFAEAEGVITVADSPRRPPFSPLRFTPPSSLPKPGHVFYRDLSGKLKQGPFGSIHVDRSLSSTRYREINETYEDLYEPLAQTKKLHSDSRERFSNLGNRYNLHTSNWKSEETRIRGRRSNNKPEHPRGYSRSRSTDFDRRKSSHCNAFQRLAGSRDRCHSNVPAASGHPGNPQYFVGEERQTSAITCRSQPFLSLSDETNSGHSERRQRQQENFQGNAMQIPNADDENSSDESTRDWAVADASRFAKGRKCESFDWHRANASNSLERKAHRRKTFHNDGISRVDIRGYYVPTSRTSCDRLNSERRKCETMKTFKEETISSTQLSAAELCRNLGNNIQCQQIKKELLGGLQHCHDAPLISDENCPLAHARSKECVSMASSTTQSATCECAVSCPNRSDNQSFCTNCFDKNLNSLRRADTGSNPDSGYGSKIYRSRSDCVAYSQCPSEVKCRNGDKNSTLSRSKEFIDLSAHDYSNISKISADDPVMNKDRMKRASRHVHVNYETSVDVHRQPNCSLLLTVDNLNATAMHSRRQTDGGSDLSIVSEQSDSQRHCEHINLKDFDQHRTLTTSKAMADESIDDVDAVDSLELDQKLEAIRTSYNSLEIASKTALSFNNSPSGDIRSSRMYARTIGRSTTV